MRLTILLALVLVVTLTSAQQNSSPGFFGTLKNLFRPRRQNNFRPPQPQQDPGFRPFRPQQNNFNRPPPPPRNPQNFQTQFQNPPPAPPQPQFQSNPPPRFNNQFNQVQQNQFQQNRRPPPQAPRQPAQQPQFNSQPQAQQFSFNQNAQNSVHPQLANIPSGFTQCHTPEPPQNSCPPPPPDHNWHFWNGRRYLLTWNISCSNCECSKFTADEARDYCYSIGMRPVSLDTPQKIEEFHRVSALYAQRYYWTGGRIAYPKPEIKWDNGNVQPILSNHVGQHPWSPTGG